MSRVLWVGICLAAAVGAGAADPLPVAEAARRVGEDVRFVAEVKGVSRSPRSGTLYVNFGDAYPRQVLSARFAPDRAHLLEAMPKLLGRRVEVTGKVEATSTGPIVPILAAEQIVVRPLDTAGVLTGNGEGPVFRQRVSEALRERFEAGDFVALEEVEGKWRRGRERFGDGGWKLRSFYEAFAPRSSAKDAEWKQVFDRFEKWRQQYPESIAPVIAQANGLVDYAWAARGSGWANTVSDEGWRLMAERLAAARRLLEEAGDGASKNPAWTSVMQRIALGEGWPRDRARALLDAATKVEPEYYEVYFAYGYYLQPRWHGRPGDWEKFLDEVEREHPGGLGAELYARLVWADQRLFGNVFKESRVEWPRVKAGFEQMRKRWPESAWIASNFAFLAAKAGDRETTLALLDELGNRADMSAWTSWENVDMTRRWLADPSGAAPVPYVFRAKDER